MKTVNSVVFTSPQFAVLSDSQLQDLHSGALEVLRRTGIRFYHQGALDVLKKAGVFISDGNLASSQRGWWRMRLALRLVGSSCATGTDSQRCSWRGPRFILAPVRTV